MKKLTEDEITQLRKDAKWALWYDTRERIYKLERELIMERAKFEVIKAGCNFFREKDNPICAALEISKMTLEQALLNYHKEEQAISDIINKDKKNPPSQ